MEKPANALTFSPSEFHVVIVCVYVYHFCCFRCLFSLHSVGVYFIRIFFTLLHSLAHELSNSSSNMIFEATRSLYAAFFQLCAMKMMLLLTGYNFNSMNVMYICVCACAHTRKSHRMKNAFAFKKTRKLLFLKLTPFHSFIGNSLMAIWCICSVAHTHTQCVHKIIQQLFARLLFCFMHSLLFSGSNVDGNNGGGDGGGGPFLRYAFYYDAISTQFS